jgi:hypothetical protein
MLDLTLLYDFAYRHSNLGTAHIYMENSHWQCIYLYLLLLALSDFNYFVFAINYLVCPAPNHFAFGISVIGITRLYKLGKIVRFHF